MTLIKPGGTMSKITRSLVAGTAALALFVPLAGCGAIEDKITETLTEKVAGELVGGDVDFDSGEGTLKITGEDGESLTLGSQELPENWLSEIPLPNGHQVIQSLDQTQMGGAVDMTVMMTAPGAVLEVAGDLQNRLLAAGFTEDDGGVNHQEVGEVEMWINSFSSATHTIMLTVSDISSEEGVLTVAYLVKTAVAE